MKKRKRMRRVSRLWGLPVVLFALAGWCLLRIPMREAAGGPAFFLLLCGELLFTLLPALAGLGLGIMRDDDLTDGLPDAGMLRRDLICGVFFLCPYTLLRDIARQLMGTEAVPVPADQALFFPMFLLCALLIPAAEGLYYRFWMEKRFLSGPGKWSVWPGAFLFALAGGDAALLLPRLCLSLMLSSTMRRHGSLLSSMILHCGFMTALLFAESLGIFCGGLGVAGIFIRLVGCFLWYQWLLSVFRKPAAEKKFTPEMLASFRGWKLTRKQKALLIALPVLAVLVPVISEVIR